MVANKTENKNPEKLKPRLKDKFKNEIVPEMVKEFKFKNNLMFLKGDIRDENLLNSIFFARPGHLLGPRDKSRVDLFVRLIEFLGNLFSPFYIGIFRKFKNIAAQEVAEELLNSYESNISTSEIIIHEQK